MNRGVHEDPASRIGAGVDRQIHPELGEHSGMRERPGGEGGFQSRSICLRNANARTCH